MTLGGFFCAFYGSECAVIITIAFMPKKQRRYTMFKIIIKTGHGPPWACARYGAVDHDYYTCPHCQSKFRLRLEGVGVQS